MVLHPTQADTLTMQNKNNKMQELLIKDYVANNEEAKAIITDFTTNKYIIKGSTGIGGTTSVLDITDQTIIIVSPLIGMIQSKEKGADRKTHQYFIYGGSNDTWADTLLKDGHKIINCTPDSFMANKEIFDELNEIPLFVDEFDYYSNALYREQGLTFHNHIFNHHRANYTLSTATPTKYNLDVPNGVKLDYYKISKENDTKGTINITDKSYYLNWTIEELNKGNKVLIFTNDKIKVNALRKLTDDHQLLIGQKLSTTVSERTGINFDDYEELQSGKVDYDNNLFILSTRYLIGFDFLDDASVGIVVDEESITDSKTIADIIQARGRVRNNINSTTIFMNRERKNVNYRNELNYLLDEYRKIPTNDTEMLFENITKINKLDTYYNTIPTLNEFGFDVKENIDEYELISESFDLKHKYNELVNQDWKTTASQFTVLLNSIKGDNNEYHGAGTKRLILWATAVLSNGNEYLKNYSTAEYDRLLNAAKTVVDLNNEVYPESMNLQDTQVTTKATDAMINKIKNNGAIYDTRKIKYLPAITGDAWNKAKMVIHTLYKNAQVKKLILPQQTLDIVNGFEFISIKIKEGLFKFINNNSNYNIEDSVKDKDYEKLDKVGYILKFIKKSDFKNLNRDINKFCKKNNISEKNTIQIKLKADDLLRTFLSYKNRTENELHPSDFLRDLRNLDINFNAQIKQHNVMNLYLLCKELDVHTAGFKTKHKDGRIYNPLTKTTRQLRKEVTFRTCIYDIKSAFANITNKMINSDNTTPYEKLANTRNITRDEAKKLFNVVINSGYKKTFKKEVFIQTMLDCGYTNFESNQIYDIASHSKGSFFRAMAEKEEEIIKQFIKENGFEKALRLHDSVFTTENKEIPILNIDGIEFEKEILG